MSVNFGMHVPLCRVQCWLVFGAYLMYDLVTMATIMILLFDHFWVISQKLLHGKSCNFKSMYYISSPSAVSFFVPVSPTVWLPWQQINFYTSSCFFLMISWKKLNELSRNSIIKFPLVVSGVDYFLEHIHHIVQSPWQQITFHFIILAVSYRHIGCTTRWSM